MHLIFQKIGFTTKLPKTVPTNGDDLLDTADYWTASNKTVTNFGEPREIKFDYSRLNVGDIVSIRIREDDGRICCYVNGKYKRYIDKPVNIPALRRNLTSFYGFVELSGAISKVSLLPVTSKCLLPISYICLVTDVLLLQFQKSTAGS